MQGHALSEIAPHLPLAVKQFRANIIKMTCEVMTAAAIVTFVLSGMDEYGVIAAAGEEPRFRQAEMRRYAYMCIGTTTLAIAHVLFMMLAPESPWARVHLRAQEAVRSAAQRLSAVVGYGGRQSAPADTGAGKAGRVVPLVTEPMDDASVSMHSVREEEG